MPEYETITGYQSVTQYGLDTNDDGVIQYSVAQVPVTVSWLVERITIVTSDGFATRPFRLFAGPDTPDDTAPPPWQEREFTQAGGEAVSDESSPLRFWPAEPITARWTGLTVPGSGHAWAAIYLQVREVVPVIAPVDEGEGAQAEAPNYKDLAPIKDWN